MEDHPGMLTAEEAAARLGVKRETLYAYVSRDRLSRTVSMDGRTSLFDPREIDELRNRNRRSARGEVGLIISSAITEILPGGHHYRGRSALQLAAGGVGFERVADLLWDSQGSWEPEPELVAALRAVQADLPAEAPLLDRLRTTVAHVSAMDEMRSDLSHGAVTRAARRTLVAMVHALVPRHVGPRETLVDALWLGLCPRPAPGAQRAVLNALLVLLADHGLATSTVAVRVAASARADPYSLISAGLGAVGGVMHGGASAGVHRLLEEAEEIGVRAAVGGLLSRAQPLPGVGLIAYADHDPRESLMFDLVGTAWESDPRLELVTEARALLLERSEVPLTIDFATGSLTWLTGMEPGDGELFSIARTSGWIAHALEEMSEDPLRFRISARYVGPRSSPDDVQGIRL